MKKKLSVVIVTYNSENHIYDCLERLYLHNDIGEALQVVIVDNCSDDFEKMKAQIEQKYGDKVIIIKNTKNGGYGQGNNIGIRKSTAPFVMIMNPDVRISKPIFKSVYNIFTKDENIVQVGLKQLIPGCSKGYSFSWKSTILPYISLPLISVTKCLDLYLPKYMYFAGSCFFLRKSSFEQVGMFDENIFLYHEEEDIHIRLSRLPKAKFVYWNQGLYEHLHLPSKNISGNDLVVKKRSFNSLKYLYVREGYEEEFAYKREIQKCNFMLWREKLLCLIGKCDQKYCDYLHHWKELLMKKSV